MWGNKLGWGISAAIVMFTAFIIYLIYAAGKVTPPTALVTQPVFSASLEMPIAPSTIVPMDQACDAGDMYRQAISAYQSNPDVYDAAATGSKAVDIAKLPGVELLVKATHCSSMTLFSGSPDKIVGYDAEKAPLEALRALSAAAKHQGLLRAGAKRYDEAKTLYQAVFSLGAKLYKERLTFEQMSLGSGLMGDGATALGRVAERQEDTATQKRMQEFDSARQKLFQDAVMPMWKVISSIDPKIIARHAGDVFAIAERAPEKVWRTEAYLKLGRYKFNAERSGDQRSARRFVRTAAQTETDPVLKTAAQQAYELTIERYRMLR